MGLSNREYAKHRGISEGAVRKAIKTGRITPEADGSIDPVKSDLQWGTNTDPAQQREAAKPGKPRQAHNSAHSKAEPAAPEPLGVPGSGTSLLQAKTVNEVVKAQTNKVRLAKLKGELIDRNQAIAHVFALARAERDAWLNWPARIAARMAGELGVDAHALHVALEAAVREHLQELGDIRPRFADG